MRLPMAATLAFSLIACASSRPAQNAAVASSDGKPTLKSNAGGPAAKGKYVCDYEEDTGSHMRQKVCRYIDENDDKVNNRNETQDNMREFMNHSLGPKGG